MPGFAPFEVLAEQMGVSVAKLHEMSKKGMLDNRTVADQLLIGMEKLYGGAMQAQMESLNGQISSLKTKFWNAEVALGNGLLPVIKRAGQQIGALTDQFNNMSAAQKQNVSNWMLAVPLTALAIAGLTRVGVVTLQLITMTGGLVAAMRAKAAAAAEAAKA